MHQPFKCILLLLLFLSAFSPLKAQSRNFAWVDPSTTSRHYIQIDTRELWSESSPGKWINEGKVIANQVPLTDLPPSFHTNYFHIIEGESIWFTLIGTGQVYEYRVATKTFRRLDRTFYRGHNFKAIQFIRKGKLYSFGGYGFWHFSNVLTYFDQLRAEWEVIRQKNLGPPTITERGFNGFSSSKDLFYTGASEQEDLLENLNKKYGEHFFAYDFKANSWTILGKINPVLLTSQNWDVFWNGSYFLKWEHDRLFIIDPAKNEVLMYKDNSKFFTTNGQYLAKRDTIYNYWNDKGNIDYFSVRELLAKSEYVGPFYSKEIPFLNYVLIFSLLISSGGVFWIYLARKKKTAIGHFEPMEEKLLRAFIRKGQTGHLSSQQVNDLLVLQSKSFDNQRRIRINTINRINQKMANEFRIFDAIYRGVSLEDKRQSIYKLSPEALQRLKEYFH
ncbi:MAG: hypothetical protein RI924_976 [Bacteroidota bacterium]|jgi:hypothetical protein